MSDGNSTGLKEWRYPGYRIALYAREPVAGQVKTRLQGSLGELGCLRLYEAMLARIAASLENCGLAPWDLWVSSNISHKSFVSLCNQKDIYVQLGADLGCRMHNTVLKTLEPGQVEGVIIIGSDCPGIDHDYLDSALKTLETGAEVVIGPAEDGGYVLIGLKHPYEALFQGIDWGSAQVLSQTIACLQQEKIAYELLESRWDVDRPEDLRRLQREYPGYPGL